MDPSGSTTYATSLRLGTKIVRSLKAYKALDVDLLARLLGRPQSVVEDYVQSLSERGVVVRTGNQVSLNWSPARG
jgi:predicted transcriptional regulator